MSAPAWNRRRRRQRSRFALRRATTPADAVVAYLEFLVLDQRLPPLPTWQIDYTRQVFAAYEQPLVDKVRARQEQFAPSNRAAVQAAVALKLGRSELVFEDVDGEGPS